MTAPKFCPVCGTMKLQHQAITNGLRSDSQPPRMLSYRCSNGHVFLVEADPVGPSRKAAGGD